MPSQYASPFDDLLRIARQQFDEVTGKPPGNAELRGSSGPVANPPGPLAVSEVHPGTVIEGTAAGIPFKLKTR